MTSRAAAAEEAAGTGGLAGALRRRLGPHERYYPLLRVLTVALGVLVAVLSLVSDPTRATGGSDLGRWLSALFLGTPAYGDKVSHLLAYGALGLLAVLAFGRHRRQAALTVLLLLMMGGLLELLQAAGGVRTGDLADMAANTLGVALGAAGGAALRLGYRQLRGRGAA